MGYFSRGTFSHTWGNNSWRNTFEVLRGFLELGAPWAGAPSALSATSVRQERRSDTLLCETPYRMGIPCKQKWKNCISQEGHFPTSGGTTPGGIRLKSSGAS